MNKLLFFTLVIFAATAAAETYDRQMLTELGYNASAADLLSASAHFLPGEHPVSIIINRQNRGIHAITFDQAGSPCWTTTLLNQLGIDPRRFNSNKPACLKLRADSDIRIEEQVERSSLRLQVSPEALLNQLQYANGGKALMVNYDARRYQYQPRNGEDHHSQTLTSEIGANFEQWIFRSGQSYSSFNSRSHFTRLYSYAQYAVPGRAAVVQVGDITSGTPLFSGITLTGAQLAPDSAIQNGGLNHVSLDVLFAQAGTAEVWQDNVLLKTFQVNAGMNALTGIPALNQHDDFLIINHDVGGGRQQQSLPFIQARPVVTLMETGTALAAGRLRLTHNAFPLIMGSTDVFHNPVMALAVGALASKNYQAGVWKASIRLADRLLATLSQTFSLARNASQDGNKKQGVYQQTGFSMPVIPRLSLTFSANFRSRDYVDTNSSWTAKKTAGDTGQIKSQYASGLSYSLPGAGVFSFSGSLSHTWQGNHALGYTLGWGRTMGRVNTSLGVQKNRLSTDRRRVDNRYVYLNLSVPLGNNRNLRSWINNNSQRTRAGLGYDQTLNDKFAWSLASEKSEREQASLARSVTWTNKYTQLSGGVSRSENTTSYNAGARGGAVWHSEGLTFTPRTLGDTFGIISLNSDQPDVKILTPGGVVWSDGSGHVVTSWTAWQKNTVQIDPHSLPKNVQIPDGISDVTPSRGAVVPLTLPAFTVRRALVTFQEGERPAPGSPVKNAKGALVAFVNEDGSLFFDDLPEEPLYAQLSNGSRCAIALTTPWVETPGTLYSALTARCLL